MPNHYGIDEVADEEVVDLNGAGVGSGVGIGVGVGLGGGIYKPGTEVESGDGWGACGRRA